MYTIFVEAACYDNFEAYRQAVCDAVVRLELDDTVYDYDINSDRDGTTITVNPPYDDDYIPDLSDGVI